MVSVSQLAAAADYARSEYAEPAAAKIPGDGRVHRAAQVGTIISVVIIAVVALVGTLILSQVEGALPDDALYGDPTNETDPTQLGSASEGILSGFAGAMELVPVVLLVLVAALVIGVVQRMRMR
ncbi:MAG: hypothetical protein HQRvContig04_25 [Haloquadratum phage sp.]|nr:MAG: hypothetical protein HQRvContig04_25 [Haloquadratum phage sp.]